VLAAGAVDAGALGDVDGAGEVAPLFAALDAFVDDGRGNAYSAKIAGRFATSLSVAAVPAKSIRCGGSVGVAIGATVGRAPLALTVALADGDGLGLGDAEGATLARATGGGVVVTSRSSAASR
jgi:hypothetical protein